MTPSNAPSSERTSPVTQGKPAVEARQGVISGRVVSVLIASTVLGVVALVVCWWIFGH